MPSTYRYPAEWEAHRATWLAWPHNHDTWPFNLVEAIEEFTALIQMIARSEQVCLVAADKALHAARSRLAAVPGIEFFEIPTNDAWIRDYGPTFVVDTAERKLAAVCWQYNGWGEKYPPFDADQRVGRAILEALPATERIDVEAVVEGGALETNGAGVLITTRSCLLNSNRKPGALPEESWQLRLEEIFATWLGTDLTIWLDGAELKGDDTDGHVDQQVRFIDPHTLLVATCLEPDDPQAESLNQTRGQLMAAIDRHTLDIEVVALPLPAPRWLHGQQVPASYLNFYACNEAILVPQFGDAVADQRALTIFNERVTDREVIGLPSIHLAYGLGSFHCLTQQEPRI